MDVVLITAYRTTGKDTFYQQYFTDYSLDRHGWLVYSLFDEPPIFGKKIHGSFAKPIKDKICNIFDLTHERLEQVKDQHIPGNTMTYRDMMIRVATEAKLTEPAIWARELYDSLPKDAPVVVTDWRFKVELEYTRTVAKNITTIRLFRGDTKQLPSEAEHDLDNIATDYLMVKTQLDFEALVSIMPIYTNYQLIAQIN